MENEWRKKLAEFQAKCRARMDMGEKQYGNATFSRPMAEKIIEAQQEAEDLANYGFMLWMQLEDLKSAVEALETARN